MSVEFLKSEFSALLSFIIDCPCTKLHAVGLVMVSFNWIEYMNFTIICILYLCSEEEAKKSIYSVSTKYYYAFSCKISEIFIDKIKGDLCIVPFSSSFALILIFYFGLLFAALPNVRWVLPDSYLSHLENCYGGILFLHTDY